MKVYFISGLAADSGVFKKIRLPCRLQPTYLDWIQPLTKEPLENYALRLAKSIDHSEPFVLIGLSLGGMIAVEIAKHFSPRKLILISSIPSYKQLPFYFRIAGKSYFHKLVPVSLIKSAAIFKRLFTSENPEDKRYLRKTIRESDPQFIRWAMDAVLKWKNFDPTGDYIHIHGSKDEILPLRFVHPTHVIKGGTHLMILSHHQEINRILSEVLKCD